MQNHVLSRWQINVLAAAVGLAALLGAAFLAPSMSLFWLSLLLGGVGVLLVLRLPGLGLAAIAGLSLVMPLEIGTGSDVALTAPVVLIVGVGLVWLVDGMRRRAVRLPASPTLLPLVLFLAAGMVSLLAGNAYWDPRVVRPANLVYVQLAQWAIWALSAAAFVLAAELGRNPRWLRGAVAAFLAAAGLAVAGWLLPADLLPPAWKAAELSNSSLFWAWLAAMAMGQLLFNGGLRPLVRLALVALLAGAAYVVWKVQYNWISGWLPFTVAGLAAIWLRAWRRQRVAGLVLGIVLLAAALAVYPRVYSYVGGDRERAGSWEGREVLYDTVLDLVKEHPVLGLGPASYRHYAFNQWLSMGRGGALWLRPAVSSHNNYIDIYAQLGVVGSVLFAWFLVAMGVENVKLLPRYHEGFEAGYAAGCLAGLGATLVSMMLVDWFLPFVYNVGFAGFRSSAVAWLFLGGAVALRAPRAVAGPATGSQG